MRLYSLAFLCASASLIALPALAQTTAQINGATRQNHGDATEAGTNPRQQLMQDLKKAGFTNIRIMPEAFIVHATNSQGEPVLMRIGPDSMEAVTTMNDANTGSSNQSMSNNPTTSGSQSTSGNRSASAANGSSGSESTTTTQ